MTSSKCNCQKKVKKSFEEYQKSENLKLAKSKGYRSYEEYQKAEDERIQKLFNQEAAERRAERERTCPSQRESAVNSYCMKACRGLDAGMSGAKSSVCQNKCKRNSGC